MDKRMDSYNDGYLDIYAPKENHKSSFGAVKNVHKLSEMDFVVSLAYEEMYRRNDDLEFAQANGRTLSLKVKTPLYDRVKTYHFVVLNSKIYSIINFDYDRKNRKLFFYLEENSCVEAEVEDEPGNDAG